MHTLEKLLSALDALNRERVRIAREGWYLQNCWLVQVKPGGNARTDRKYWQARSRQAIFDGKKLKHLKPDEVEDYKAAIARGRQLKQIDRQIEKLQQQLEQLTATTDYSSKDTSFPTPLLQPEKSITPPFPTREGGLGGLGLESTPGLTDLTEQERLVKEVLAKSQLLRASLRHSVAVGKLLGARLIDLRRGHPHVD